MPTLVIYGPSYSTYTRTARMTCEEKGVTYRLEEVDILKGKGQETEHLRRQPFGKVPAVAHDDFTLFETSAIVRYIDEAFSGPNLQPEDVRQRARMGQIMAIVDSYAYPNMITKLFIQRVVVPMMGGSADESTIETALPAAERSVETLETLAEDGEFLIGSRLSLADLYLVPVMDYLSKTPEGEGLLRRARKLSAWWGRIGERQSVRKTRPALG